jgi:hypothetical protein
MPPGNGSRVQWPDAPGSRVLARPDAGFTEGL